MDRSSTPASPLNLLLPQWRELVVQWAAGEFSGLPAVQLLPAASLAGAAGAYALSTGTIYLNADWLQQASEAQVLAVLTEELGHHLDGLLNRSDAPGDEGELFAVLVHGAALTVEQAALTSTPIAAASPGRTRGEFSNFAAFAAAVAGDPSHLNLTLSGSAPTSTQAVSLRYTDLSAATTYDRNGSARQQKAPLSGGFCVGSGRVRPAGPTDHWRSITCSQ